MSFSILKKRMWALWHKFNLNWSRASEIQDKIDQARRENYYKYRDQWKI